MRKQSPAGNMAYWNLGQALHLVKTEWTLLQYHQQRVTAEAS